MKIFTVATTPNYNYKQANRFLDQLGAHYKNNFKLYCYTDDVRGFSKEIETIEIPQRNNIIVERQWNKIDFFSNMFVTPGEVILISDLDWTFKSDVTDIIDTPVMSREFIAIKRWWLLPKTRYFINGGMYKFISGELTQVYNQFYKNPSFWQQYYIKRGFTQPPVNGEQNFVRDAVGKTHLIKFFEPFDHIGRLPKDPHHFEEYNTSYMMRSTTKDFYYMDGELNPNIRMVHSIF